VHVGRSVQSVVGSAAIGSTVRAAIGGGTVGSGCCWRIFFALDGSKRWLGIWQARLVEGQLPARQHRCDALCRLDEPSALEHLPVHVAAVGKVPDAGLLAIN
jgi:hypothetical protein